MLISVLDILALQLEGGGYQPHVRRPDLLTKCDGGGNLIFLQFTFKIKQFAIKNFEKYSNLHRSLHFRACSAISLRIAFSMIGDEHSSSKDLSPRPCFCASSSKWFWLGTTSATVYCFVGSPYTQMFSMIPQVLSSDSTLPRETYSPACSLTRSFLRSAKSVL